MKSVRRISTPFSLALAWSTGLVASLKHFSSFRQSLPIYRVWWVSLRWVFSPQFFSCALSFPTRVLGLTRISMGDIRYCLLLSTVHEFLVLPLAYWLLETPSVLFDGFLWPPPLLGVQGVTRRSSFLYLSALPSCSGIWSDCDPLWVRLIKNQHSSLHQQLNMDMDE